ncbi:hypothetical protein ABZ883_04730 [Streptomyces sp. NPDC046977]|uniref:hypothetical protein n=1 Tax=Streptomyces sp. NPDC046977 TaxID=3154703 RepID=UPI0033CA1CBF
MSSDGDGVYVVLQQPTQLWFAGCCDNRCPDAISNGGHHNVAEHATKTIVDRAATRHRRLLRTLPPEEPTRRTDVCETCGQSARATDGLRRLVAELEEQLAQHTRTDPHA